MAFNHFGLVVELDLPKKTFKDQTDMLKPVKHWLEYFWSQLHMGKKSGLNMKAAWQRLEARLRGKR